MTTPVPPSGFFNHIHQCSEKMFSLYFTVSNLFHLFLPLSLQGKDV